MSNGQGPRESSRKLVKKIRNCVLAKNVIHQQKGSKVALNILKKC